MVFSSVRKRRADAPFNLAKQDRWNERAAAAVALWESNSSPGPATIADIGAGNARIRPMITRPDVTYVGFDLLPQHNAINALDIRRGLPALELDVCFMLGLIEYVEPASQVIEQLPRFTRQTIVSYCGFDPDRKPLADRQELGWVRHETREVTERRFIDAGFRLRADTTVEHGATAIWLWEH